jgi:putative FmdB family regulatory protein
MPIFEYQCRECGTKFEKIVSSSATSVVCRSCESPQVEKLLSIFAVSGGSTSTAMHETGPCGTCGAPQRGMCGE